MAFLMFLSVIRAIDLASNISGHLKRNNLSLYCCSSFFAKDEVIGVVKAGVSVQFELPAFSFVKNSDCSTILTV